MLTSIVRKKFLVSIFLMHSLSIPGFAHQGEPSHGGDLPSEIGTSRMQYEGATNLTDIRVNNETFLSDDIAINIGDMVAFENQDGNEHQIQFKTGTDDDEEEHDHPVMGHELTHILSPGKHWILSFLVPGLYPYQCLLHGEKGQIFVRY